MTLWNDIKEGLLISVAALKANRLRAALTTLGIIIGIVTVSLMGTAIEGLNTAFKKSISSLGADVLYVQRTSWFIDSQAEWIKQSRRPDMTLEQANTLRRRLSLSKGVAPFVQARRTVSFGRRSASGVSVNGTTEDFMLTTRNGLADGRFFTASEAAGGRPVCVIGQAVATNLFGNEIAIGKRLKIGQDYFDVVGVMEKEGNFLGQFSLDNQLFVPLSQFKNLIQWTPDFQVHIKAVSLEKLEEMREELRGVLRSMRRVKPGEEDNFAINDQQQFLTTFYKVGGTIASVGLFITSLSLFVGGIGIMNIMFVSVAERTREIGIRKALGAKKRSILIQFLTEAAAICLFGGFIGLAIAWGLTLVMNNFLPAHMSLTVVGIAILVSVLTGLISGFIPAWRASRMNPVDALRNE